MKWNKPENRNLLRAVLALKSTGEAQRFMRDLMTENEISEFAKRLEAARMLAANEPYSSIENKTGLSSTTVARVSKWLKGKQGGYRRVLSRLHHRNPARTRGLR